MKASVDIPFRPPFPQGANDDRIFTALVASLCSLLIDNQVIHREELVDRAISIVEDPDLAQAADLVSSIRQKLVVEALDELKRKHEAEQAERERNQCPVPRFRRG